MSDNRENEPSLTAQELEKLFQYATAAALDELPASDAVAITQGDDAAPESLPAFPRLDAPFFRRWTQGGSEVYFDTAGDGVISLVWWRLESQYDVRVFTLADGSQLCLAVHGGSIEYRSPTAPAPITEPDVLVPMYSAPGWFTGIDASPITREQAERSELLAERYNLALQRAAEDGKVPQEAIDEADARRQLAEAGEPYAREMATTALLMALQGSGGQTFGRWREAHYPEQS